MTDLLDEAEALKRALEPGSVERDHINLAVARIGSFSDASSALEWFKRLDRAPTLVAELVARVREVEAQLAQASRIADSALSERDVALARADVVAAMSDRKLASRAVAEMRSRVDYANAAVLEVFHLLNPKASKKPDRDVQKAAATIRGQADVLAQIVEAERARAEAAEHAHHLLVLETQELRDRLEVAERERDVALMRHGTFEGALRIARGCTDYGGGYGGRDHDVYQHGIGTVIAALERARKTDTQTAALTAIGDNDINVVRRELDALRAHYDAAGPEHNLLALLDLYHERKMEAERERDDQATIVGEVSRTIASLRAVIVDACAELAVGDWSVQMQNGRPHLSGMLAGIRDVVKRLHAAEDERDRWQALAEARPAIMADSADAFMDLLCDNDIDAIIDNHPEAHGAWDALMAHAARAGEGE